MGIMRPWSTVAIVPMKPLAQAKTRLSAELSESQRVALGRNLLRRVLRAVLRPMQELSEAPPVEEAWVVGGDPLVKKIAGEEGARWSEDQGADINDTLLRAFQEASDSGKAALYLPGDLPFLRPMDVHSLVVASGHLGNITLAPDRQRGGTNGILVPPSLSPPLRPQLGPDSFSRHLAQAESLGIPVAICYSSGLALDLDTLEDVEAYERMEPRLMETLTSEEDNDAA